MPNNNNQTPTRKQRQASTLPPVLGRSPVFPDQTRPPTAKEWVAAQVHFKFDPSARIPRGEQHPNGGNLYFLGYNRGVNGGERWGTKEELVKLRKQMAASRRRHHAHKMKWDAAYRAESQRKLEEFKAKKAREANPVRAALGKAPTYKLGRRPSKLLSDGSLNPEWTAYMDRWAKHIHEKRSWCRAVNVDKAARGKKRGAEREAKRLAVKSHDRAA